ncbi:MAG: hypothetical protein MK108_08295 [Mariniblastus sp.]|nr:hypothetical protein [Mariniblastus sp.]
MLRQILIFGWFWSACLLLPVSLLSGQETESAAAADWEKETAQKEIDGMRRYAWVISESIANALQQAPTDQFPGIHAWLADFRQARQAIDPETDPGQWEAIDLEALVSRNPNYWSAVCEVAPANPLMMWLHSSLYAVNGEVPRTSYLQTLALHSPVESKWKKEMQRLLVSSTRLNRLGSQALPTGIEFFREEKFDQAAQVFEDVLSVIPSHSISLYELGNAQRKIDSGQAWQVKSQASFDRAKRADPFRIEAYQGDFSREAFEAFGNLRSKTLPAWRQFQQRAPEQDTLPQLEALSVDLQAGGVHELALVVRQLAVAHRDGSYNDEDRAFLETNLQRLLPEADVKKILTQLQTQTGVLNLHDLLPGK